MQLPFTIQRIERVWVGGIGSCFTGTVSFEPISYWNSCLSVIGTVIETFVEAVVYQLLNQLLKQLFIDYFLISKLSNLLWVSGAAHVSAKPHEPCICIYVYVTTK